MWTNIKYGRVLHSYERYLSKFNMTQEIIIENDSFNNLRFITTDASSGYK